MNYKNGLKQELRFRIGHNQWKIKTIREHIQYLLEGKHEREYLVILQKLVRFCNQFTEIDYELDNFALSDDLQKLDVRTLIKKVLANENLPVAQEMKDAEI